MMGGHPAHLSASATQIYPSRERAHSDSPSHSPSVSPARSSSAHSHSEYQLNPISPSSDGQSSKCFRWIRILDITRLALTVLIIGAAAAVVGCEAHALSVYNASSLYEGWALPGLWPSGFDLRPTQGMLVGGTVALLMGLSYVALGVVPLPHRFNLLVILVSISLAFVGLVGAVFGIAYTTHIRTRPGYDRDNIQSWTCRWVDGAKDADKLFLNGLAGIAAPGGFKRVCMETQAGFGLLAILICLETAVLIVTGLCAWMEVRMRRLEKSGEGHGFGEKTVPSRSVF